MENPAKKTVRAGGWFLLGVLIGLVPDAIKIDQMRQATDNSETFQLRSIADLKHQMHDEEMYYMKEMAVYRHALGIRLSVPTVTDISAGMTCVEEFGTPGQVGFGRRSWKPRDDGRCYVEDGWR